MPGIPLKEVFARFGVEFDTKAVKAGAASVDSLEGKIKKLRDNVVKLEESVSPAALGKKLAGMRDELKKLEAVKDPTETQRLRMKELKNELAELESGRHLAGVNADIGKLQDEIASLEGQRGLAEAAEGIEAIGQRALVMGGGLIAGAIAVGVFVRSIVQLGLQLGDTARDIGTSATELTAWQQVAERSGVAAEAMNSALSSLGGHIREANARTGDARYMFQRLHVEWRNADGTMRDTSAVMMDAGRAVASIGSTALRARLGAQVFGDSWRQLAPIFEGSGRSIEEMRQEVRDLVGGDMEQLTTQSRALRGEQARFNLALQAVQTRVALQILPAFSWLIGTVSRGIAAFKRWTDQSNIVRAVLGLLAAGAALQFAQVAVSLLRAFGPQMLARLPIILFFIALALVVDDLIALFSGGRSIIGEFIDKLFGPGTSVRWVAEIRDFFEHFGQYMSDASTAIRSFFTGLFAEIMDGLFSGIPGYQRRVRPAPGLPAGTTTDAHGGLHSQLSPRALANIAAATIQVQGRVTPGARGVGAATQRVDTSTHVGQIVIPAAADPEGTARAVRANLNQRHDENIRAARRHLTHPVRAPG